MVNVDWNSPDAFELGEGNYRCRVVAVSETRSRNGDLMLVVNFIALDWGHAKIEDRIMLSGKGVRFGLPRLVALGVPRGMQSFDEQSLVGAEVYVAMHWREYEKSNGAKGRALNVDTGASPHCGYWPAATPPESVKLPEHPIPEPQADTPF